MKQLDPILYEIFRHRLFNILEEGRIAIKMVSGSPVVVEGGETMCSIHAADGTTILTAAGVLLHAWGARDFIKQAIEWYEDDPGFQDGDQLFFNDPYIGGQHLADYVIVKPIFHEGRRIAWTGSIMHTAETGGIEPGGMPASSMTTFQEGIKISGLKVVEGGRFRKDVFNTIVHQVRDPHLVGLDTKAKIAANNVCANRFLELVEKYGVDFVETAGQQIIDDSEKSARARLKALPDGVWQSRMYGDTGGSVSDKPFKVECRMTKEGDEITFDYTGSSPQNEGSVNCTLPATWGQLFAPLCSQLFWDVSWNAGLAAPVKLVAPEGTVVNCRFPAACATGVLSVGLMIEAVAHACIAKMLYAGGEYDDVNAGWVAIGCNPYFGGINQFGDPMGGAILDGFAAGVGATPDRDGVDSGGVMMNPSSCISDIEMLEFNIPFMYLARRHDPDSGGFGKHRGGDGIQVVYMIYGTNILQLGLCGAGKKVPGSFGMFGGWPSAFQEWAFVLDSDIPEKLKASEYPANFEEAINLEGKIVYPSNSFPVMPVKEHDILASHSPSGGGYGDPLERDPQKVKYDLENLLTTSEVAEKVYGVVIDPVSKEVDLSATEALREGMLKQRIKEGKTLKKSDLNKDGATKSILRVHEYLEIAERDDNKKVIRCMECGHQFCETGDNYKNYSLQRVSDLSSLKARTLFSGETPTVVFQEYICPQCGRLLEVDPFCKELGGEEVLWDINVNV